MKSFFMNFFYCSDIFEIHLKCGMALRKAKSENFDAGSFKIEDKQFYEENGYIIIKNLIQSNILKECRNRAKELCAEGMPKGWAKVTVDEDLNWIEIEDILWDPIFSKIALNSQLLNAVESITGPNVLAVDSKLFQSPGGKIDIPYSREMSKILMRPENSICCTWTTVENLGKDKRSLFLVPGTHQLQMNYIREGKINEYKIVELILSEGDTLLFHPLIFKSPIITEKNKKHILSINYASADCLFYEDDEKLKIKDLPSNIVLEDFWNLKFRLARGSYKNIVLKNKY